MQFLKKIKYRFSSSTRSIQKEHQFLSPKVVKVFTLRYPYANAIQWQQIDVFRWQVNFTLRNKWYSALFDSNGNWLETTTLVSMEAVPKNIQQNFEKSFVKSGIKIIRQVDTNDKTIYEFKWTNGIFIWKLLYDISGKMVGKLIV